MSFQSLFHNKFKLELQAYFGVIKIISMLNPEVKQPNPDKNQLQSSEAVLYKKAIMSLQSALQKKPQLRTTPDTQSINNFVQLSPFFSELAQEISTEFARNIIKKSKVFTLNGSKKLQQKGEKISMIFMVLTGDFFVKDDEQVKKDNQIPKLKQVYSSLIRNANKSSFIKKQSRSLQRRVSFIQTDLKSQPVPNFSQIFGLRKQNSEGKLLLGDLQKQKYTEDLYLKGEGYLLALPISSFYECLLEQYQRILQHHASYFRTLRCFDFLDENQLKIFIEKIRLVEYKKDEFVFRQGEPSTFLYLMIEGEAKASKNVALFKQDPNTLYRGHVRSQSGRRAQKPQEFAYVNFQGVFNYTPKKVKKDLGILSPITIFGQQQMAAGVTRQAEVQITSTQAKIYRFTLGDIQTSGNGKKIDIQSFLDDLYQNITSKRITVRRKGLSTSLSFQNKRNMNYFYIQPTPTPRKRYRSVTQKINNSICPKNIQRPKSSVKPRYHNFNFNQFLQEGRPTNLSFTNEQKKIARLTHNSHQIAEKVEVQSMLYTQRQSYKHKINVVTPLFDTNYYKKQRKQALRVQNKRRMQRIEVHGVSSKKKAC